jgi:hypothetical protein
MIFRDPMLRLKRKNLHAELRLQEFNGVLHDPEQLQEDGFARFGTLVVNGYIIVS